MARILGLDLGANSLGWALIDDYGLNDENSQVGEEVLENNPMIIDGGVRVFLAGYENLGEGEKEVTRNVARRMARGMRRRYFRRMLRRRKLMHWLKKYGFIPKEATPKFFSDVDPYPLRKAALERPLTPEEFGVALYHLNQRRGFKSNRKAGNLSEKSVLYEGSVKKKKDNNAEQGAEYDGGMIGINETLKGFDPEKTTFGAYLATLDSAEARRRARYTLRKWYEDEFDKLWEAQQFFHPKGEESPFKVLHDETTVFKITEHAQVRKKTPKPGIPIEAVKQPKAKVILRETVGHKNYVRNEIIFYQRPLKSQKDKVGMCILEPKSRRCPASHPVAQRFRMLQQINNLTITTEQPVMQPVTTLFGEGKSAKPKTRRNEPLSERERTLLIDYLSVHESVSVKDIPKIIEIPKEYRDTAKFNLSHQGKIKGCVTNAKIVQAIGRGKITEEAINYFQSLPERDKEQLWRLLYDNDDPERLAQKVQRKYYAKNGKSWSFDFDDEQASKFADIGLEDKYVSLSLKAMNNLLPYMEKGLKYHKACEQFTEDMQRAGKNVKYHHSDVEHRKIEVLKNRLPLPPDVRNPLVNTALYELRRVVNAIIAKHGRPDIIRIELARELKKNKEERKQEHDAIRENQRLNDVIRERLAKELNKHPLQIKKSDIVKYRLWLECGEFEKDKQDKIVFKDGIPVLKSTPRCPFTGKPIAIHQLFNGEVDVEHIIPLSRSLDDSFANKTLCYRDFNAHVKGQLTPYELFKDGPIAYGGGYITYEEVLERVKSFPRAKRCRFEQQSLLDEHGETFVSRQLNDTRYMTREAVQYLRNICKDVQPLSGGITALLRESWGLTSQLDEHGEHLKDNNDRAIPFIENPFLNFDLHESELSKGGKSRLDHRHHFIDAVVIALTERNAIQKISTEMAADRNINVDPKQLKKQLGNSLKRFLRRIPLKRLVPEVRNMLANIVVSFKKDPITKVQGKFHKETIYGRLRTQVRLKDMQDSETVEYIVDETIKEAVRRFLRERGVKVDANKYSFTKGILKDFRHPVTGEQLRTVVVYLRENGTNVYASREKLEAMKDQNSVEYIVCPIIRNAAREFLRAKGVNVDETDKNGKYKYSFKAGLLRGLRHPQTGRIIRAVRVKTLSETLFSVRSPHPDFKNYDNYYVQNDGNHHAVIYESFDKKGNRIQTGEVVTLLEAYRRVKEFRKLHGKSTRNIPFEAVVKPDPSQGKFLYTLQINDLFLVCKDEFERQKYLQLAKEGFFNDKRNYRQIWDKVYRIQKMSQGGQYGVRHASIAKLKVRDKEGKGQEPGFIAPAHSTLIGIKLNSNPSGYLSVAEG